MSLIYCFFFLAFHSVVSAFLKTRLAPAKIPYHQEGFRRYQVLYDTQTMVDQPSQVPECFILLSNLQSGSNIGAICRNAMSFNVSEIVVVGRNNYNSKMRMADRGAKRALRFVNYPSTVEAAAYLKNEKNALILGLEILPSAKSLLSYQFLEGRNVAFVFGNEGAGLSEGQRKACDGFLYVPQYSKGLGSINVACVSAIVLHTFAASAQYTESIMASGAEKFA